MRGGRARARLQGRAHARALPDRARQDPAEPLVGDVRAAPAPARDRDQAGAAARVAALHQGIRRGGTPQKRKGAGWGRGEKSGGAGAFKKKKEKEREIWMR